MKKYTLILFSVLYAASGSAQELLKVQNAATITVQAGAEITVMGNITLDNGSKLVNNGTVTLTRNGSAGTSNFFDNTINAYSYGSGKVVFNSAGGNNLYSNNIFARIDVNAAELILGSNITANHWYLQSGRVTTGSNTAIVLGIASSDLEAGTGNTNFASSWINGNLRRYISPGTNDMYQFAVGSNSRHLAALENLIANPLTNVQYIDADYTAKPGTDAGLAVSESGTQYISVNPEGVWHFVPNAVPTAGKFNLKLFTDGFTGLVNNQFAILQRADQSANSADWMVPAASSLNPSGGFGRMAADGYALRKNIAGFGQFGIGQTAVALPVTLTNFTATRISNTVVQLAWETQVESNNQGFAVERRHENETSFTTTGFINSKAQNGNSAIALLYGYSDNNTYGGVSYYRLKQTDLDGKAVYSMEKAVSGTNGNIVSVLMWPNPSQGQFSIRIEGNNDKKQVMITDLQGKLVRLIPIGGSQQVNVSGLTAGTYVIAIPNAMGLNANFNEKIVVIR